MEINPDLLLGILKKTPLPLIADDLVLEYIRFKNMGLIGKDKPMEQDNSMATPYAKVAYEMGSKYAVEAKAPPLSDLFGPNRSVWERMIIGQLMGELPGMLAGKIIYPDDPASQQTLAGTTASAGALGAIAYPEVMKAFGRYPKQSPIGFKDIIKNI
jgi:hypothetical protein